MWSNMRHSVWDQGFSMVGSTLLLVSLLVCLGQSELSQQKFLKRWGVLVYLLSFVNSMSLRCQDRSRQVLVTGLSVRVTRGAVVVPVRYVSKHRKNPNFKSQYFESNERCNPCTRVLSEDILFKLWYSP